MKKLLLSLMLLAASPSWAAYSFTTNNAPTGNSGSSLTCGSTIINQFNTLSANTIPVVMWTMDSTVTGVSVTDSASNSWTTIAAGTAEGGFTIYASYANNVSVRAGNDYVTVQCTGTPVSQLWHGFIAELAGGPTSSPLGQSNSAVGTSTTAAATLTGVTSGSALLAWNFNTSTNAPTSATGGTLFGAGNNASYGFGGLYNLSSGSGTLSPSINTSASETWDIVTLAFSPSGGGGPPAGQGFFIGRLTAPEVWAQLARVQQVSASFGVK